MYKSVLPLLVMALALASATAAFEIAVSGVKGGHAKEAKITKTGVYKKKDMDFDKISDLIFDPVSTKNDPHVFAVCVDRANKGPTAMVFTPAIMETKFFKERAVNTEFSSTFHVLPLTQIDQVCQIKGGPGILAKLINDRKQPKPSDKTMPTHAMLFRNTTIFAVPPGFDKKIIEMEFANNKVNEDYTVYLCQKAKKVTELKSSQKDVAATNILAVEIVAKSGKPAEGGRPCDRFLK